MSRKIKVMVVDDSELIRQILNEIINSQNDMEVIAEAEDPYEARNLLKTHKPDVLTLDVEMPKMDGVTFLKNLMRLRPMPVVMISTLTKAGAQVTLDALEAGAFDYLAKPSNNNGAGLQAYSALVLEKIRAANRANTSRLELNAKINSSTQGMDNSKPKISAAYRPKINSMIMIGASTGGTEAIKEILEDMPANCPPIIVTQHIPEQFSASYANRLDASCQMNVFEAQNGQKVMPGNCYIAPGGKHMVLAGTITSGLYVKLLDSDPVNRHKPSVEVMFDSALDKKIKHLFTVMLTGMGADGAKAMLRQKENKSYCIIQNEESSVVWGMPGECYKLGAYDEVTALNKIASRLIKISSIKI